MRSPPSACPPGNSRGCPVSSSPPNGGFVMITSTRSLSPISRSGNRSALPGSISGYSTPWSSRFIWQSRYGRGFGSMP